MQHQVLHALATIPEPCCVKILPSKLLNKLFPCGKGKLASLWLVQHLFQTTADVLQPTVGFYSLVTSMLTKPLGTLGSTGGTILQMPASTGRISF